MTFKLEELSPADGATKRRKRVGRGFASGHGKTATRGYNGQGQRSGESKKPGFEGGQMPLFRRTPKKHTFERPLRYLPRWVEVNVGALGEAFTGDTPVTPDLMASAGLVKKSETLTADGVPATVLKFGIDGVRILGNGEVSGKLEVHAHHFTKGARSKIEAAGGKCVVLGAAEGSEDAAPGAGDAEAG